METVRALADYSIRRACGFAAFGIGTTMLALSFDPVLCFRTGAVLMAALCFGLLVAAWRAPRRDMRHTELWAMLATNGGETVQRLLRRGAHDVLASVLRDRLMWHADRVAGVALMLWLVALLFWLHRALH